MSTSELNNMHLMLTRSLLCAVLIPYSLCSEHYIERYLGKTFFFVRICILKFQTTLQNADTLNSALYRAQVYQKEHRISLLGLSAGSHAGLHGCPPF